MVAAQDSQAGKGETRTTPGVVVHRQQVVTPPTRDQVAVLVLDGSSTGWTGDGATAEGADVVLAPSGHPAAEHRAVVGVDDVDAAVDMIVRAVVDRPTASWCLARLLPLTSSLAVPDALVAESAAYSTLLAGAEFRGWLDARGAPRVTDGDQRLRVERTGDELIVTLDRPARRNAYDAAMRDALLEALEVARLDPDVHVTVRGAGPDFCAGGDLDEFGTAHDVAAAHRLRVTTSPAGVIHAMRERVTAEVHGHAVGSGIEIAAFAGTVQATTDARFALPEVAMGLIPGAGGTVSIVRRIGRHRLLWWALSGQVIDAVTAREWGLVDELAD